MTLNLSREENITDIKESKVIALGTDESRSVVGISFGTFPKKLNASAPRSSIIKPHVPPKPLAYALKSQSCSLNRHTIPKKKSREYDNYFEAVPVVRMKAMDIEKQNLYDSATPVCHEKLDEECAFDQTKETFFTNMASIDNVEHVYNEPTPHRSSIKRLNSRPKDSELAEEVSDDDDNLDADYYSLQKYKNQSRASWIERVESMRQQQRKQNLDRILSNTWKTQDLYDEDDEIGESPEENSKETSESRFSFLNDVIKDEKSYAENLKKILENSLLISVCDPSIRKNIESLLEVIGNLLYLHTTFSNDLQKALSRKQVIGEIIKKFVQEEFIQAREYMTNYRSCINITPKRKITPVSPYDGSTTKKKDDPSESNEQHTCNGFTFDTKQESMRSFLTSLSLPIWRFQNCIHFLKRLIKYTPTMHQDYDHLATALQLAKGFFNDLSTSSTQEVSTRYLVKKGLVVEKVDNIRKLRLLFLFNDVIICAKQKINKLAVRWFHPLHQLSIDERPSSLGHVNKDKMDALKKSLIKYQADYTAVFKKTDSVEKNKKLEPLKKKLMELETELVLNSPYLTLVLVSSKRRSTILLSSDYERAAWKMTISNFINKANLNRCKMSLAQANLLINDIKISPPFCHDDVFQSSRIDGLLRLTIHKFLGLQKISKIYCTVEVDSFGHFFLKAKTNKILDLEPEWNEDFDIELEGANTLRIMCYETGQGPDVQLGSTALELNEAWLKDKFIKENVPISANMFLKISVEYSFPNEGRETSGEGHSFMKGSYFGVPLEHLARLENSNVPVIITSCLEEIEKRGMKDTGLYRISGLSSEIQKLKAAFNRNPSVASTSLKGVDISVLTGTVKLFLRELPDPLFPSSKYHDFITCIWHAPSQDENLKRQMAGLPSPNFETILFLLNHLVRVSEQESSNRMSLGNLATIFGPNLMKNPSPTKNSCHEYNLTNSTSDITHQCKVVLRLLTIIADGFTFFREK